MPLHTSIKFCKISQNPFAFTSSILPDFQHNLLVPEESNRHGYLVGSAVFILDIAAFKNNSPAGYGDELYMPYDGDTR
jgi:hypothetical protein